MPSENVNPIECTLEICALEDSFYDYLPSLPLNALLLALFAASLAGHLFQAWKFRTWTFLIGMGLGCVAEIIGYAGRVMSHNNPFNMNAFLIQICCLTIAPAFFAASIYITLSRIVIVYGRHLSRIPPRAYTYGFIACDFVSLCLQGAGGGLASVQSQNGEDPKLGTNIMVAGLSFQVATMALFIALCLEFASRVWRHKARVNADSYELRHSKKFQAFLGALALSTVCIFIRSIYRVIELAQGWNGSLISNETYFFILEGVMVIVAVLAFNVLHPGWCFEGFWNLAWKQDSKEAAAVSRSDEEL